MIRHLSTSAIDYMSNFICHHEFEVLGSKFISNEQPVLYFDGSYHVVRECTHHHLILHHLLLLKHSLHLSGVLWVTVLLLLRMSHLVRGRWPPTMTILWMLLLSHYLYT